MRACASMTCARLCALASRAACRSIVFASGVGLGDGVGAGVVLGPGEGVADAVLSVGAAEGVEPPVGLGDAGRAEATPAVGEVVGVAGDGDGVGVGEGGCVASSANAAAG